MSPGSSPASGVGFVMKYRQFGFIGLGTMGRPMATRLLEAGHSLVVYDARAAALDPLVAAGARRAGSLVELMASSQVVFLSLPTPDVVRQVVIGQGGIAGMPGADVVVDLSTTGPRVEEEIAAALGAKGKVLVDCPISGGAEGAAKGTLALMAAGPDDVVADLSEVLSAFGTCFQIGTRPGQGQTMKVINNLMSTAALAITSETMVLGVKAGLDPDQMLDVINAGSGRNTASTSKFPRNVLPRTFDFGMSIKLSSKDARLCLEEADRLGVPMIVGNAVRQLLNITRDHLGGDVDMTSVVRVVEEWAGCEVRGKAAGPKAANS